MQFINIGFGNMIASERLVAIVSPDSAPIKRMVQESRERGMLIRGGEVNTERASVMLLDEYRGGKMGKISFERPPKY